MSDDSSCSRATRPQTGDALRETLVLLLSVLLLAMVYYHGAPRFVPPRLQFFWWVGLNLTLLLLLPVLVIRFVWGESVSAYGLALGDWRVWGRWLLVFLAFMVPVLMISSRMPSLQVFYPRYPWARESMTALAVSSAGWFLYFLAWEFFFRGFLLNVFLRRHPPAVAIALQTVPFVMMHFSKPEVEALASIVAGVALGCMAYRGRSMVGAWLLHWCCAFLLDIFVIFWPLVP